jgi:hypothetical protein
MGKWKKLGDKSAPVPIVHHESLMKSPGIEPEDMIRQRRTAWSYGTALSVKKIMTVIITRRRDSSIVTMIRLRVGRARNRCSLSDRTIRLSSTAYRPDRPWVPPSLLSNGYWWGCFAGGKSINSCQSTYEVNVEKLPPFHHTSSWCYA